MDHRMPGLILTDVTHHEQLHETSVAMVHLSAIRIMLNLFLNSFLVLSNNTTVFIFKNSVNRILL